MTQPALKQSMSFVEFTDSVFAELHAKKWNSCFEIDDPDNYPYCWEETLIPLAIRLYNIAQEDEEAYWWLLRFMSQLDLCKHEKEDFRKSNVFRVLSEMKSSHYTTILKHSVPQHFKKLQDAIKNGDLNAFRELLPNNTESCTIYDVCRVLLRLKEIRRSFNYTLSSLAGDTLAKLFFLFSVGYNTFACAYEYSKRPCDGMMKNIFLVLYQSQYQKNRDVFCELMMELGNLWEHGLMMSFIFSEDQMPQSVREELSEIFHNQHNQLLFELLKDRFDDCDTVEQRNKLIDAEINCLKIEKYSFVYQLFDEQLDKNTPPFSFKLHKEWSALKGIMEGCEKAIIGKNLIPMEELRKNRKDVTILFELVADEKNSNDDSDDLEANIDVASYTIESIDEGEQPIIEETINQKARRLIGVLLQKAEINNFLNESRYTTRTLDMFFDAILIGERTFSDEKKEQDNIAKKLFQTRSGYKYDDMVVMVLCFIIGHLLSNEILIGTPIMIAEKIQPLLTKTRCEEDGEEDPKKTIENLRSYIQKAKDGNKRPPGKRLIDIVIKELKG